MAQYPIKMLKDENGTPFVPLVAPEAVKDTQGTNWQTLIDKKLEKTNIIAGDNITLSVSGNDITINSQAGGSSLNNVLDGNAIGSARTIGAKDSEGQPLGEYAWAEGKDTIASGRSSHAEGDSTRVSGTASHAEGAATKAPGNYSHAEGMSGEASGTYSHAEGYSTIASGDGSHAEGNRTTASSPNSHAEGENTTASGNSSHAEGYDTKAQGNNQHVQGKYNISDTTSAHIVGNGTKYNARSNAHTIDWSGNAWFAGDVYTGSTSGKNKDDGSKKLATEEFVTNLVGSTDIGTEVVDSLEGNEIDKAPSVKAVKEKLSEISTTKPKFPFLYYYQQGNLKIIKYAEYGMTYQD